MSLLALDTSVAIPLLVETHSAHTLVTEWLGPRTAALAGHAVAETYAVLTRLPGDIRLSPADAARVLTSTTFLPPLLLAPSASAQLPELLGGAEIAGGAVYDALVGLAAREHNAELATRDARATATYEALGVRTTIVA
ncbi:MAG: PIN domain-containing protein [Patulibacter sp.]